MKKIGQILYRWQEKENHLNYMNDLIKIQSSLSKA
jgi:hypothetical protein